MANNIYQVTYQVHLPDTTQGDTKADVYRRDPVEAIVVAAGQDPPTLSAVINANIALQAGKVYDILEVEQVMFGTKPLFQ